LNLLSPGVGANLFARLRATEIIVPVKKYDDERPFAENNYDFERPRSPKMSNSEGHQGRRKKTNGALIHIPHPHIRKNCRRINLTTS